MTYRLFIDDERDPPNDGREWIIARSSKEAIMTFYNLGSPDYVSFDHDLGGDDTSIKFVDWMIDHTLDLLERDIDPGHLSFPKAYYIHSQNSVGAGNIDAKMKRFIHHLDNI